MDYTPKDLRFDEDGRSKLIDGITKMSNAVKSTLGPSGHTVLIESADHTRGITVTKDGVTVAKSIDLLDPVENLAVRMMREAADRTATEAGDGNLAFSPLSIATALGMARAGAEGTSADQLDEFFGVTPDQDLHRLINGADETVRSHAGPVQLDDGETLSDIDVSTANRTQVREY